MMVNMKNFTLVQKLLIFALLITLLGGALTACSASQQVHLPDDAPDFIRNTYPDAQQAYMYALSHPHELEYLPCYCGCVNMGHTDNLDCYIAGTEDDGTVIWDPHAAACGVCVLITQDAMRLGEQGKSPSEIRDYIDATYSYVGPGTDTPYPEG